MSKLTPSRSPVFFCFCGPTASGKSTISRELLKLDSKLQLSISTTTRAPRPGEKDGEHYFFVSEEEFNRRIANRLFMEHAMFSMHYYGTEKRNIELAEHSGRDLLLDIDLQGVKEFKRLYPAQTVTTFVFPPSFADLKMRLVNRASDSKEQIKNRLEVAQGEIELLSMPGFSDYFLLNDQLEEAVKLAQSIVSAERIRMTRFNMNSLKGILKTSD